MGIFDRLKNAILGTQLHAGPVQKTSSQQPSTPAAPSEQTAAATPRADSTQPAAASERFLGSQLVGHLCSAARCYRFATKQHAGYM